jgi:isopentenyl-diphosphate delta-isomerase
MRCILTLVYKFYPDFQEPFLIPKSITPMSIPKRKDDHIKICREKPVQFKEKTTGFEAVELVHNAVPELSLNEINTTTQLFKKELKAPLIVAAITGGTEEGRKINQAIARTCQKLGLGFGVGSQRAALENPDLAPTFKVRDVAPDTLLLGNLGLVQFCKGYALEKAQEAVDMIEADGLCIHLNPAHEAAQPEGDTDFRNGLSKLKEISKKVKVPVIAKECGCGISRKAADSLIKTGIRGIDVGGAGGTSWVGVEFYRSDSKLAQTFWDWGIPTAASVVYCSGKGVPVIATGGIRTGLDAAKAIAMGADAVGIALPALLAYPDQIENYLTEFIEELKTAMFLIGSKNIQDLKKTKKIIFEPLKTWISS